MKDAISLGVGEPDFVTPWAIREAGIYSLEKGRTYYTANAGLIELRQEIADFNATINKNNKFSHNFFVNWFYVDCENIEPITISNGVAR